jgi:hypothetical protein
VIAVQLQLGPVLSQDVGLGSKTSCAGIAVEVLLALDHESGCMDLLKAPGAESGLTEKLEQNASSQKP